MRLTDETKLLARLKAMELAVMSVITALSPEKREKFDADLARVMESPASFEDGEKREGMYAELYRDTLLGVLRALLRDHAAPGIVPDGASVPAESGSAENKEPVEDLLAQLLKREQPATPATAAE